MTADSARTDTYNSITNEILIIMKTYVKPMMETLKVDTEAMLQDSLPLNSATEVPGSSTLGKNADLWDFEDEEEY